MLHAGRKDTASCPRSACMEQETHDRRSRASSGVSIEDVPERGTISIILDGKVLPYCSEIGVRPSLVGRGRGRSLRPAIRIQEAETLEDSLRGGGILNPPEDWRTDPRAPKARRPRPNPIDPPRPGRSATSDQMRIDSSLRRTDIRHDRDSPSGASPWLRWHRDSIESPPAGR
jgi:hypothetical protein